MKYNSVATELCRDNVREKSLYVEVWLPEVFNDVLSICVELLIYDFLSQWNENQEKDKLESILYETFSVSVFTNVTIIQLINGHSTTNNRGIPLLWEGLDCILRHLQLIIIKLPSWSQLLLRIYGELVTSGFHPHTVSQNTGFIYSWNRKGSSFILNFPQYPAS